MQPSGEAGSVRRLWPRLLAAATLVAIAVLAVLLIGDDLQLQNLVRHEAELRHFQVEHPILVYGIAFLVYVTVTGLSIPVATGLSLLYAWYFGFWRAGILVSFASTAGATIAFLLSRFVLREIIQRNFGDHLARFNAAWEKDGAFYLLSLRLMPIAPFFVVNAVMGLTPIRVRTFWWASQIGMLPSTLVYTYAGSTAPDLRTLAEQGLRGLPWGQIIIALTLLGLLPIVMRWFLTRLYKTERAVRG